MYSLLLVAILIQFIISTNVYYYFQSFDEDIKLLDESSSTSTVVFYYIDSEAAEELIDAIKYSKNQRIKGGYLYLKEERYSFNTSYITIQGIYKVHNFVDILLEEEGTFYLYYREKGMTYKGNIDGELAQKIIKSLKPRVY